jgi:hypothetical protein
MTKLFFALAIVASAHEPIERLADGTHSLTVAPHNRFLRSRLVGRLLDLDGIRHHGKNPSVD